MFESSERAVPDGRGVAPRADQGAPVGSPGVSVGNGAASLGGSAGGGGLEAVLDAVWVGLLDASVLWPLLRQGRREELAGLFPVVDRDGRVDLGVGWDEMPDDPGWDDHCREAEVLVDQVQMAEAAIAALTARRDEAAWRLSLNPVMARRRVRPTDPQVGEWVKPARVAAREIAARLAVSDGTVLGWITQGEAMGRRLPSTGAALAVGALSPAKARAMARAVGEVSWAQGDAIESQVLPVAPRLTAALLQKRTAHVAITADPAGARQRELVARATRRVARPITRADGMAVLSAVMTAQQATEAYAAIDATARSMKRDGDVRTLNQLRADALHAFVVHRIIITHPTEAPQSEVRVDPWAHLAHNGPAAPAGNPLEPGHGVTREPPPTPAERGNGEPPGTVRQPPPRPPEGIIPAGLEPDAQRALAEGTGQQAPPLPPAFASSTHAGSPGTLMPGVPMSGESMSGEPMPGEVMPGGLMSGEPMPDRTMPGELTPGEFMPGGSTSGESMPGGSTPGEVMPGDAMPGEVMPGDAMSGKALSGGEGPVMGTGETAPDGQVASWDAARGGGDDVVVLAERRVHADVNIVASLDVLTGSPSPGHLPGHGPVTAEAVREVLALAQTKIRLLATDKPGEAALAEQLAGLIGVSPGTYLVPALLKTLLAFKCDECANPWCTNPALHADTDHTQPFAEGGTTTPDNLMRLCRWCHALKTFTLIRYGTTPAGEPTVTTQLGHTYHGPPPPF